MADNSGGHGGLYFIVGAIAVVVVIMGVILFGGLPFGGGQNVDVKVEAPKAPAVAAEAPKAPEPGLASSGTKPGSPAR